MIVKISDAPREALLDFAASVEIYDSELEGSEIFHTASFSDRALGELCTALGIHVPEGSSAVHVLREILREEGSL